MTERTMTQLRQPWWSDNSSPAENMFDNTWTNHSAVSSSLWRPHYSLAYAAVWKPTKICFLFPETLKFLRLWIQQ